MLPLSLSHQVTDLTFTAQGFPSELALGLKGDFALKLLSDVGIVKSLGLSRIE